MTISREAAMDFTREIFLSATELARRALGRGDITAAGYERSVVLAELHCIAQLAGAA